VGPAGWRRARCALRVPPRIGNPRLRGNRDGSPEGFPRSYAHIAPATWSDDGVQALCLMASAARVLPVVDRRLRSNACSPGRPTATWPSVGGSLDIGMPDWQRVVALRFRHASRRVRPPWRAQQRQRLDDARAAGPRSSSPAATRTSSPRPRAIPRHPPPSAFARLLRALLLWARFEIHGHADAWEAAVARLQQIYQTETGFLRELEEVILPAAALPPGGTGYVVDSLLSARHACRQGDYASIVRAAVALGNDTDTTACLAGGSPYPPWQGRHSRPMGGGHARHGIVPVPPQEVL